MKVKAECTNNTFVDDKLKYEDYKIVLFNATYVKLKMSRIQNKN